MNNKFIRIMAIVLAAVFVLGVLFAAAGGAIMQAFALETEQTETYQTEIDQTGEAEDDMSSASSLSDKTVRVGLFFRNSSYDLLRMNHSVSSVTGFRFFMTGKDGKEIVSYSSPVKSISIVREDNVALDDKGVYTSVEYYNASVKTFALRMKDPFADDYPLKQEMAFFAQKDGYDQVYPIMEKGSMYLGIGDFESSNEALRRYEQLRKIYTREMALKSAKTSYITVIDNETGKIVLRADTADSALKVEPNYMAEEKKDDRDTGDVDSFYLSLSQGAEEIEIDIPEVKYDTLPYIVTAVNNVYAGTFEYMATDDGLELVNILSLEDYVKSVVPFEISADWPKEAIKAFAVAARTYALTTFHSSENFDMCSETHCQVYMGRGRSTEYSDACVDEVAGMILTYDGKPAKTFYHAISGGVTESVSNVWGSNQAEYPYLVSVLTPEEKYATHPNGLWSTSVTMSELSDYIRSKSSYASKFTSDITDITVLETTPAGYVYKLLLTDADGNQVTVTTADSVRILLSKFVNSANFVISRGLPIIKSGSNLATILPGESYPVLTAAGEDTINTSDTLYSLSSGGTSQIKNDGSMQFIGKGYGHGVGMSQYGAHDMAEMGYDYQRILTIYYPGTAIIKG